MNLIFCGDALVTESLVFWNDGGILYAQSDFAVHGDDGDRDGHGLDHNV